MKTVESIEAELRRLDPGWWERMVQAIPELAWLANTPQPRRYHAEGDVAQHTRLAVEACPPDCDLDLLWAALLHDVGKPLVTKDQNDKITAHGHHAVGAEIAEKILIRLEMVSDRRDRIVWAVRYHTFHLSWNLTAPWQASRRHKRFVADPRFPLLLELLRVDSIASLGNPRGQDAYHVYVQLRESVVGESPSPP
ncbi:MAG: HD domain-containing protein [Deltaproteobacteria bacterium]|nr:MAG: HD domain-containing protein [Deltaproteobacteria bacterium]